MIAFFLVWADGIACFYLSGRAFESGSPTVTTDNTELVIINGTVAYITASEEQPIDALLMVMMFGITAVMVLAVFLHFALGVKLFPTPQASQGRWRKSRF
jgi:hypothetical protein